MSSKVFQPESAPDVHEIIGSRQAFYIPVSLDTHDVFCGDEREIADVERPGDSHAAIISPEEYVHWFGGGLNIPYNLTVMEEAARPGSVKDSFEARTKTLVPDLIDAGIQIGVHSDVHAEQGKHLRLDEEGDVGCGYAGKRQQISHLIEQRGIEIVADASVLRPELFQKPQDYNYAHSVVTAHGRLANRDGFFTSGRRVMFAALGTGAKIMLVQGEHTAKEGVINLVPGTSLNNSEAARANLPAYNQDSWAVEEANDHVRHLHPHDKHEQQIAELIDTIGTMRALGVQDIAVRRSKEAIPQTA